MLISMLWGLTGTLFPVDQLTLFAAALIITRMTTYRGSQCCYTPPLLTTKTSNYYRLWQGTNVVEGSRVGAGRGQGDFHLEGGDERVMGGAGSSLGLPPVLTQAASQQEVLPRGFVFTRKTQEGILCRDTTAARSALHTLYEVKLQK